MAALIIRPSPCDAGIAGRLRGVRLLAMDVDGVLTDGGIILSASGGEAKRFHAADGLGLVAAHLAGIKTAWVTGRESAIVTRRARELNISYVVQGARNKASSLRELLVDSGIDRADTAYVGDDWNDLPAFEEAGIAIAVANAVEEVRERADAVTLTRGGDGAIREVIDAIMAASGVRRETLARYLSMIRAGDASGGAASAAAN